MDEFFIDVFYNKTGTISKVSFSDEDVLHYGKKGMRWGVRNRSRSEEKARAKKFGGKKVGEKKTEPDAPTEKTSGKKPKMSPDAAQAARLKEKKLSELNNEQIMALTKRMQLEKTYNELMAQPKTPSKMDERFAKLDKANKRASSLAKTAEIGAKFVKIAQSDAGKMLIGAAASTTGAAISSGIAKNAAKKGISKKAASTAGKAAARRAAQMAGP